MNNHKIGLRLMGAFALVSVIVISVGFVARNMAISMMAAQDEIVTDRLESVKALLDVNEAQTAIDATENALLLKGIDPKEREANYSRSEAAKARMDEALKRYGSLPRTKEEDRVWNEFLPVWRNWIKDHEYFMALSAEYEQGHREAIYGKMAVEAFAIDQRTYFPAKNLLKKLVEINNRIAQEQHRASVSAMKRSGLIIAALIILGAVLSVLIGLWMTFSISGPLKKLKNGLLDIGKGRLDVRVAVTSTDEIGDVAGSFNKMADELHAALQKEKELAAAAAEAGAEKRRADEFHAVNQHLRATEQQLRATNETLRQSEAKFRSYVENAPDGIFIVDENGRFMEVNGAACRLSGYSREELCRLDIRDLLADESGADGAAYFAKVKEAGAGTSELWHMRKNGSKRLWTVAAAKLPGNMVLGFCKDVTERRQDLLRRELTAEVLGILNEPLFLSDAIERILAVIKRETGFDAVGIRVRKGDDFPYFVKEGFSSDFLLTENTVVERSANGEVCRDKNGDVRLECGCGLVLSGRTDPANPLFTPGGSFWTNDSIPMADLPPDQDPRNHPRNRCMNAGFCSVALVPIRVNRTIVGLLQLNNRKKNSFTIDMVHYFEDVAESIGVALKRKNAEDALRESEEKLRQFADSTNDWIYMTTMDDCIVYTSPSCKKITGYGPDEFIAKQFFIREIIHPDDRETYRQHFALACSDQGYHDILFRIVAKGGNVRWISHSCVAVQAPGGGTAGRWATNRDVTEQKQAQDALRESEEKFRSYINNAPDGIFIVDETGRYLEANESACRNTGYSQEELCALSINELLVKESYDNGMAHFKKVMKTGAATSDLWHMCKDGSKRCLTIDAVKLSEKKVLAFAKDVTGRKYMEAALKNSEEKFRNLFEKSRDALMTLSSPSWKFNSCNRAAIELFGVKEEAEVIESGPWEFSPELQPDGRLSADKAREMIEIAVRNGSHFFEWTHKRLSGEEFPATVLLSRIARRENETLLATVRDISVQKSLEENLLHARKAAEEASKAKSMFLAHMSHEIRTPLNGIIGFSELLVESGLSQEQLQYAELMRSSGASLLTIINDVLDFSKIEAGRLELEKTEFDLRKVLGELEGVFSMTARKKGIELTFHIGPNVPLLLIGDSVRLRQIITNLLGNAVKFTEKGSVSLTAELDKEESDAVALRFTVRDTGIGISNENAQSLFSAFEQGDKSTTRRFGGTGLGLAISKQLVEKMGGRIDVESGIGRGSEFRFTVQLTKSTTQGRQDAAIAKPNDGKARVGNANTPENLGARLSITTSARAAFRILIAEDNIENQMLVMAFLKKLGFSPPALACNGAEAVKALRNAEFDIVLMDCQMPEMDGFTATHHIREARNGLLCPEIPIVAMTANATEEDRKACLAAGMSDYLSKPIQRKVLAEILEHWLSLKEEGGRMK